MQKVDLSWRLNAHYGVANHHIWFEKFLQCGMQTGMQSQHAAPCLVWKKLLFFIRTYTWIAEWCFSLLVGCVRGWVSFHSLNISVWLCKSEPLCVINIPWYGAPNFKMNFCVDFNLTFIAVSCQNTLKFAVYVFVGSRRWKSAEYRCWFVCIHRESHGAKHRPTGLHY